MDSPTDATNDPSTENTLFDRIAEEVAGSSSVVDGIDHDVDSLVPSSLVPSSLVPSSLVPSSDVDAIDEPGAMVVEPSGHWPAPDISTQIDRPRIAERQCSRSDCSDPAAVTLSYHYGQSQVWIDRLSPEREPHSYDMCDHHAERLSVPRGWHLDDRRGARRGSLIAV